MIGQSGCFGSQPKNDAIDNAAETSAAVDAIIETVTAVPEDGAEEGKEIASALIVQHYAYMAKRVSLLTWAVVALAAYILIKEVKL